MLIDPDTPPSAKVMRQFMRGMEDLECALSSIAVLLHKDIPQAWSGPWIEGIEIDALGRVKFSSIWRGQGDAETLTFTLPWEVVKQHWPKEGDQTPLKL